MGVVLARTLLAGGPLDSGGGASGADLVARILGPERRTVDPALLASIAADLRVGVTRVMWLVTAMAALAAVVAWLFPHVPTKAPPAGETKT